MGSDVGFSYNLTNGLVAEWGFDMGKHYPTFHGVIDFNHLARFVLAVLRGIEFQRASSLYLTEESGHSKAIFVVFDTTRRLSVHVKL